MKIDRWFNVLVLGGAAMALAGCPEEEPDDAGSGGATAGSGSESASTGGSNAGVGGSETTAAGGSTSTSSTPTSGAGGETSSGPGPGAGGMNVGGGLPDGCSTPPDPSDPCGCPCCWAEAPNDGPECTAFCSIGNNGAGCCM